MYFYMKRLTLLVSGKVQQTGYRDRVIELGKSLGLTGYAENLSDGLVKIVAEGDENKLELFKEIVDIKNTLINVEKIEYRYAEAAGEFSRFSKLVNEGETDTRLDTAANLMKELIVVVKSGFNGTIEAIKSVKGDTSMMLEKQDITIQILQDVKEDTSNLNEEMKKGFGEVKKEMRTGFSDIKEEMKKGFGDNKEEMKNGFGGVRHELSDIKEATYIQRDDFREVFMHEVSERLGLTESSFP